MRKIGVVSVAVGAGGLIAGMLIGFIEVASLAILGGTGGGLPTLFWAAAGYGLAGLLGGLAIGFAAGLLLERRFDRPPDWWVLIGGAVVLGGLGMGVLPFRLLRDLFQERASFLSLTSLVLHLILLFIFGGIFAAAWSVAQRWTDPKTDASVGSGGSSSGEIDQKVAAAHSGAPSTSPAPVPLSSRATEGPSRRTFLKTSLTAGLLALPAAAAASQLTRNAGAAFLTSKAAPGLVSNADKPNILMIIVDTLRADHIGVNGYAQARTPNIDALAADSLHFEHAFAQAAWTKPSVATLLTSLYPSSHTAVYKTSALPSSVVTLPEVLRSNGYFTGGFANNVNIAPLFDFQKGFDTYEFLAPSYLFGASEAASQLVLYQAARRVKERLLDSGKDVHSFYQPADVVNARAMRWLKNRHDGGFFLMLHYMEPHDPYFEHPYDGYGVARVSTPNPPPDMAQELMRLYDAEIAYFDQKLGELLDWLRQENLYDNTLIVFLADHGEEFQEHGGWWHGLTLYDEQIHVPLFFKMPGQALSGKRDSDLARLLDVAPTLLGIAGLEAPAAMQGVDLLSRSQPRANFVFAEEDHQGNVLRAGRSPAWKLIEANSGNPRGLPAQGLYDLVQDPHERTNLAESELDKVAEASQRVEKVATWAVARAAVASSVQLDQARKDAMEKTGYGR